MEAPCTSASLYVPNQPYDKKLWLCCKKWVEEKNSMNRLFVNTAIQNKLSSIQMVSLRFNWHFINFNLSHSCITGH
jgi:hypothetical protein